MTGHQQELSPAADESDNLAPLRALGRAAAEAAVAVSEAIACGQDSVALAAVAELDAAYAELARLAGAIPALLRASFPGRPVEDLLVAQSAELARAAESAAVQRTAVAELEATQTALAETVAAHQELRDELTRLRRLERLAEVLPELEGQRQLIEDRVAALTEPLSAAEGRLIATSETLITLSAERMQLLEPQARELLGRVAAEHARLAAVEAEVASQDADVSDLEARAAQLRDLQKAQAASLRAHAEADRALLQALTGLEPSADARAEAEAGDGLVIARRLLSGIESQLAAIDAALSRTVLARELTRAAPG